MIVAAAQFSPTADGRSNRRAIARLVAEAADGGARLVVLPEYAAWFRPRFGEADPLRIGEQQQGFPEEMCALAERYGVTLVAGMLEQSDSPDPRPYNTVLAVSAHGRIAARYRKVHLYDAFGDRESDFLQPGDVSQRPALTLDGLRYGLQTCFDLRFPEVSRHLVDLEAEALLVAAQWVPGPRKAEHWETLIRARAIENLAYVVAAGQGPPYGVGQSMIVDPVGVVLARVTDEEGIAMADVSAAAVHDSRRTNPCLGLRRFATVAR